MNVQDLIDAMQRIAPPEYGAEWDNVGLLVGVPARTIRGPVFMTIDLTEHVLEEAIEKRAGAIIAYHPPIWEPLRRLTDATPKERIAHRVIEAGIAVYSPHTALDAASGGVTDWLCEGISGGVGAIKGDCRALQPHLRGGRNYKVVTFVPEHEADPLREAMASAGAGHIGDYRACSFMTRGTGTFLGQEGTHPTVGEVGRLEKVPEVRLEMVCSAKALPLVMEILRRFHPYEEPAIDVLEKAGEPDRYAGMGRKLVLDQPATLAELAARVKAFLNAETVRMADAGTGDGPIHRIGACPGAGASLAKTAIQEGCQVFITGEMKHHEVIAALHDGMSVILAGHTHTERGYLPRLAHRLRTLLPELETVISSVDRSPLVEIP